MRELLLILGRECTAFLLSALFLVVMMSNIYIDVMWMNDAMHETSFTETTQEILLALIASSAFVIAGFRPTQRGALILMGGFYTCMLIRELDFLFDDIWHGSWVCFALATALSCIACVWQERRQTLEGLVAFIQHRSWPVMATGLLIVLVFSRLFGMHALWQHLMLDDYNRVAKNMAEEGTELLGYSVCFLAYVRYAWQTRSVAVAKPGKSMPSSQATAIRSH